MYATEPHIPNIDRSSEYWSRLRANKSWRQSPITSKFQKILSTTTKALPVPVCQFSHEYTIHFHLFIWTAINYIHSSDIKIYRLPTFWRLL